MEADRAGKPDLAADLVLEGGGVKGIALVGAVTAMARAGYRFPRVAGTSAGAVVGAVLAALQTSREPVDRLADIARTLDYAKFRDRGFPGRYLGPLGPLTDGLSVLLRTGAHEGNYLQDWVAGVLSELGVETFGDLRTRDVDDDAAMHSRYALVVTASDVSRRRLVRLPWDYAQYGLDPDEQPVASAVRASASIPFFFEPVTLVGAYGVATLVDGGLLSNYPIGIFDRQDERRPRWPTIGVRLDATGLDPTREVRPVRGPVAMGVALLLTSLQATQAEHALRPCNVARSVYVDTPDVDAVDFDLTESEQEELLTAGAAAARRFLDGWNYERWLARCRASTA